MADAHFLTPVVAAVAQASFTDAFFLSVCSTDRNKSQGVNDRMQTAGRSRVEGAREALRAEVNTWNRNILAGTY